MMKKMIAAMVAAIALIAGTAHAGDGRNWTLRPATTWTVNDRVSVTWFFSESGTQIGAASTAAFDTAATVATDQLVDGGQFLGSGRTICLNATSFREAEPTVGVVTPAVCFKFPFNPLDPVQVLSP